MDHRALGRSLDLFSISEEAGVGLVLWHPRGATVRRLLRDFWEKVHLRNGYKLVSTPHIANASLWETSGHMSYFSENMYALEKAGDEYVVKPMNCPLHIEVYRSRPRSYRELPLRYAEWGTVYRYERSGTLHGLLRVRGFTQDDAHIFCTAEQLDGEIDGLLELCERFLGVLGFEGYRMELSTRDPEQPGKYMGAEDDWRWAQEALADALERRGAEYEEVVGEAAFYGPKIDVHIVDSSDRTWQCSTFQFDFNLPSRFNLEYMGADGALHTPYMIHRVLLGAVERFFGILLEHYKGNLPTWLTPVQVRVLPITSDQLQYAKEVHDRLSSLGYRSELDESTSTLSHKIREAETYKVPYILVCGRREAESGTVSVRRHGAGDMGSMTLKELTSMIEDECSVEV